MFQGRSCRVGDQSFKRNQIFSVHSQKTSQCDGESVQSKRKNKERPMSSQRIYCLVQKTQVLKRNTAPCISFWFTSKSSLFFGYSGYIQMSGRPACLTRQADILHAAVRMQKNRCGQKKLCGLRACLFFLTIVSFGAGNMRCRARRRGLG